MEYPVPPNETERLAALASLGIVGSDADPIYERICRLARDMFGVPAALITLLDCDTQWFKACVGFEGNSTPRSQAFCNYSILSDEVLVAEDARNDPRFSDNPLVRGPPGIRFYAGAPLALKEGCRLGTLCLLDFEPRQIGQQERANLEHLASVVVAQFELHRSRNEAKLHQKVLAASEERLRLAVQTTGLGSWEYSRTRRDVGISTQGRSILGIEPHAPIDPATLLQCIHYRDRRDLRRKLRMAEADGRLPVRLDVRVVRPSDHEERWIALAGAVAADGSFAGTFHDISDLKVRAQQQQGLALLGQIALGEAGERQLMEAACEILRKTLGVDLVGVGLADRPGGRLTSLVGSGHRFQMMQQALIDADDSLLNKAFKASAPVKVVDTVSDDDTWRASIGRKFGLKSAMAVGIGEATRRHGAIKVACVGSRYFSPAETSFLEAAAFVLAAALERRASVASLRVRDRALDAADQGIAVCEVAGSALPLVYVNPAIERQTGYTGAELNARAASILLCADEGDAHQRRALESLAKHGRFSGRVTCRRRDGARFQAEVSVSAVRDETGRITHYVAVHTDVTERLRLESDVRQAQKMDAIGKLTGGVAHDFNNLLTVILGNSEIIAESAGDPELRALAEMIVQAAERGADMVQRLLAFGRRQDLQPENLDVNGVLLGISSLLRRSLGEEVFLRDRLEDNTFFSRVDKGQLETAILNLVVNARDAMPGGGAVTLATRRVVLGEGDLPPDLKPGAYVSVTVADTGAGIPAELVERVFEPFFTTKEVGKGTGLGLSMVYGFAQQSGGHARIRSEVGRGTTVEILLPLQAEQVPEAKLASTAEPAARGRERILVVEDQDEVRNFVTAQLVSLGYDVASVPDGPAALSHLQTGSDVELLFTDIIMPGGLDGVQLAERATRLKPELRVLFTTGYSDLAAERSKRFLDGRTPVLKKPYRRSELSGALRAALGSDVPTASVRN